MIEEPFSSGNSLIHRIDPRFRVVAGTFFSFAVALCNGFPALMAALAVSIAIILLSGLGFKKVLRRLAMVNVFILFFWAVLPLTYPGDTVYALGPVRLHMAGILLAAQITIKSNAILMVLIALVATMTLATLGHTLSRLKMPEKLVFLLMLTYRYIFVIQQEYQKIIRSIKIRGFIPKTSLHTYKTYAYVVGMLLIRASERADRVYDAMRCRGFKGKYYSLAEFQADKKSWVFMTMFTAVTILIIGLEVLFHG
ncbi:MAG: cobalt ECF transporter T component CbiQ [Desulfosalsimonadaceae bacterium]|nr:cobalt ECF transporter T component CbiQ [Desulfosalsimonadaceae bacterium]